MSVTSYARRERENQREREREREKEREGLSSQYPLSQHITCAAARSAAAIETLIINGFLEIYIIVAV
jgi:hypothetical protein